MRKRYENARLESLIRRARVRFMERLRAACFHGRTERFLVRYRLAEAGGAAEGLLPLAKAVADLVELRLRQAWRGGYLSSCLADLDLADLLARTDTQKKRPSLHLVQRENQAAAAGLPPSASASLHLVK